MPDSQSAISARRSLGLGILCGFLAVSIWAGQISVNAVALRADLNTFDVTAIRAVVAGLVLLPVLWRAGFADLGGIGWRRGFILAACAGPPFTLLNVGGLHFAPPAHAAVINPSLTPFFTALLAVAVLRLLPPRTAVAGLALIILGVVVIGWQGLTGEARPTAWIGDIIFAVAALLWAGYTVFSQRWGIDPLVGTAVIAFYSMILYLPPYLAGAGTAALDADARVLVLQAVYQGLITGVVSIFLYTRAVGLLGGAPAALFVALIPALGILIAVATIGEDPSALEWTGMAVVTVGMVFALAPRRRGEARHPVAGHGSTRMDADKQ
jgi:drug/metabolite transporter (DMT)-like permease